FPASPFAPSPTSTWCATRWCRRSSSPTSGATRTSAARPTPPRGAPKRRTMLTQARPNQENEMAVAVSSMTDPLASLAACIETLQSDPRQAQNIISRPRPLLGTVRQGARVVLVAPASAWDHGRDVFRPYAEKFAEGQAMLVLLGRPR